MKYPILEYMFNEAAEYWKIPVVRYSPRDLQASFRNSRAEMYKLRRGDLILETNLRRKRNKHLPSKYVLQRDGNVENKASGVFFFLDRWHCRKFQSKDFNLSSTMKRTENRK